MILGPGELVQAHQTDEYAEIRCIEETTELYRELAAGSAREPTAGASDACVWDARRLHR